MLEKQISFHHSVTELGNIQVREVIEYVKNGEVIDKKYSNPMTTADTKDMTGWDDRSKEIVAAIIDLIVLTEFETEKQVMTGTGIEEIVTHDRVVEPDGKIAVRQITRIFDDGVEVSKKYHRGWIMPGDDPSGADVISKAVAQKLHTAEVITTYKETLLQEVI